MKPMNKKRCRGLTLAFCLAFISLGVVACSYGSDTASSAYTLTDGEMLTGSISANVKITVADGATLTLKNVTIDGEGDGSSAWAGLTCLGDAEIILEGENTVTAFSELYSAFVSDGRA